MVILRIRKLMSATPFLSTDILEYGASLRPDYYFVRQWILGTERVAPREFIHDNFDVDESDTLRLHFYRKDHPDQAVPMWAAREMDEDGVDVLLNPKPYYSYRGKYTYIYDARAYRIRIPGLGRYLYDPPEYICGCGPTHRYNENRPLPRTKQLKVWVEVEKEEMI